MNEKNTPLAKIQIENEIFNVKLNLFFVKMFLKLSENVFLNLTVYYNYTSKIYHKSIIENYN